MLTESQNIKISLVGDIRYKEFFKRVVASGNYSLGLDLSQAINSIGHPDTDAIIRGAIPELPKGERITISPDFKSGDILLVMQYKGSRLPEGATTLPEGSEFEIWEVSKKVDRIYGIIDAINTLKNVKKETKTWEESHEIDSSFELYYGKRWKKPSVGHFQDNDHGGLSDD
jgi:hypothetical protein